MRFAARPTIYELNTAVWLTQLGVHTLSQVPARAWDGLAALPVDAVWLMGVGEPSPAWLEIALSDPVLAESFRVALPDLRAGDVIGSPYCVRRYEVDERFGGVPGVAGAAAHVGPHGGTARALGLILDYVPNHVAPDHPWVSEHPEFFVRDEHGEIALGRDPYFPPWPDVVQLNAFHPGLRSAVADMLVDVGGQCDGLR